VELTQALIDKAKAAGACAIRYAAGTPIESISAGDLRWLEDKLPDEAKRMALALSRAAGLRGTLPVSFFSMSGDGYGYGYGDGYGDGYGYGYGDGYGDGDGYGYGCGDGYGYGSGYGDGYGSTADIVPAER